MGIVNVICLALQAYIAWVKGEADRELDQLEDEIYKCIDDGSASAKLRLKRLEGRRQRKLRNIEAIRSTDDPPDRGDALPVSRGNA
jgi:hypothetical protein